MTFHNGFICQDFQRFSTIVGTLYVGLRCQKHVINTSNLILAISFSSHGYIQVEIFHKHPFRMTSVMCTSIHCMLSQVCYLYHECNVSVSLFRRKNIYL